jgi:hypothetical protein
VSRHHAWLDLLACISDRRGCEPSFAALRDQALGYRPLMTKSTMVSTPGS